MPGATTAQSPVDRALSLSLSGNHEGALAWAAALVEADPAAASGLLLLGRELAALGQKAAAREALDACAQQALDAGRLPLAAAASLEMKALGQDAGPSFDAIAEVFARGSARQSEGGAPPPPPQPLKDLAALPLKGPALLDRASRVASAAAKALADGRTQDRLASRVAPAPLFSALDQASLRRLLEVFEVEMVPSGAKVITQGEPGTAAYVVVRGDLDVVRETGEAAIPLARLTAGAIFGEMALLSRAPRTASVVARTPSVVLRGPKAALDAVAERDGKVGAELAAYCRLRMVQNLLKTSPVLGAVAAPERAALVERFVPRSFEPGEALITQGDSAQGLFFVALGGVEIVRRDGDDAFVLASLGAGDSVGEVALVLRRPATADVVAVHPTVTLFLPRASFLGLIHDHPLLLARLYELAIKRDDETSELLSQEVLSADVDDVVLV
jgi:cAMP-dependent protein kinase regulator